MTLIKNLNKSIVKKNIGFNLREDLNFSDDGNRFRGFDYKGLPITTLRTDDTTYLCIRVDYRDNAFTYNEWSKTEEYRLADEFNGVSEIDLDKLIENCERIIAKVAEMNEKAKNETVDLTPVKARARKEVELIDEVVEKAKANLKWWELSDYEVRNARGYVKSLLQSKNWLTDEYFSKLTQKQKRETAHNLEAYGYVQVKDDNYYIRALREMLA